MRVVMLLGRSTGGIGTHVAQLSADLRGLGVDVIVVTHPLTAATFDLGPVRLLWPGSAGWVRGAGDLSRLRRLVSTADIVHAHGHQGALLATLATWGARRGNGAPKVGAAKLRAAKFGAAKFGAAKLGAAKVRTAKLGAPKIVVSQHNAVLAGSGRQALKRLAQRWVAARADLVTGASSDLVEQALAFGAERVEPADVPSPRVPALLAQPPADPAERARLRGSLLGSLGVRQIDDGGPTDGGNADDRDHADPDLPLVVTISRIAPQKNLPVLVQAASRLHRRCTWVVLGGGDPKLLARLRGQARALAAPVHFIGARGDVDQWLRAAEVFVLPSRWEARALVVQEAMAAGTPVVASDVGGLHDLVSGTGLLVIPGDGEATMQAITAATDSLLADPALRAELVARGRQVAAALPDGPATAARWLARYAEILQMT